MSDVRPRNEWITTRSGVYNCFTLMRMARDLNAFDDYDHYWMSHLIFWIREFMSGGAMPGTIRFRGPRGFDGLFLDILQEIWDVWWEWNELEETITAEVDDIEMEPLENDSLASEEVQEIFAHAFWVRDLLNDSDHTIDLSDIQHYEEAEVLEVCDFDADY
ncbi:MAG: hypothetical protein QKV63_gp1 [Avonheates virus SG_146]|uniref:hypothetical protein n=1 Tax=Avonheates virus SG_146 TaxID=2914481 RepID=UPI002481C91F|nr:MAG: hypothetical protein QKV63_gp1 [Avonheates virus SG_146]UNI72626.1 MAG: hypothetical protein [Avonheates virus SG_146]